MAPPLVSVIMSVFNGADYIPYAIESVLNQTFHDFEFIIINDGSTDGTSEILNTYHDSRLVVVERKNLGLSVSLNEALSYARGQYIARMDADDVALPNRLELQFNYMEQHPSVGILGGQAFTIDEDGRIIGKALKPVGFANIQGYLKYACPVLHPTYFVRRSVYSLTNGYRVLPIEDYDFLLRAIERGVIIDNLPQFIVKYRTTERGLTLANPQRTIVLTNAIKKMHIKRIRNESEDTLFDFVLAYESKASWWFNCVHRARSFAIRYLLYCRRKGNRLCVFLSSALVASCSLFHYHIFINSYVAYKASRFV